MQQRGTNTINGNFQPLYVVDGVAVSNAAMGTCLNTITGHGSTQVAIDPIKTGAYDYMNKPIDPNKLLVSLQNMAHSREESRKVRELQNRLDERFSLSSIIGRSPQMQRVFELIRRSAQAFSTVLILGESGTGKELEAQAIHKN